MRWERDKLRRFITDYPTMPLDDLCRLYGRTRRSIASTASRLRLTRDPALKSHLGRLARQGRTGSRRSPRWTDSDKLVALALYGVIPTKAIARRVGRAGRAIFAMVARQKKVAQGVDSQGVMP